MKLKDEADQFVAFAGQFAVGQAGDFRAADPEAAGIRLIEQTEQVEQGALAAARRADDGMHGGGRDFERDAAQDVDARLIFAEVALQVRADKSVVHCPDPRKTATGSSRAARRDGR